jgi:hypothetical protein
VHHLQFLAPWSTVLHENLIVAHLLKECACAYTTRTFIAVSAGHCNRPDDSTPRHHTPWHMIKIHFNIFLSSTHTSHKCSPPFRFPDQKFACISHFSHAVRSQGCSVSQSSGPQSKPSLVIELLGGSSVIKLYKSYILYTTPRTFICCETITRWEHVCTSSGFNKVLICGSLLLDWPRSWT